MLRKSLSHSPRPRSNNKWAGATTPAYFRRLTVESLESRRLLTAVLSIDRATPAGPITNAISVDYEVTFSEPVTGVDASDFALALGGSVTAATPVTVSGSGSEYTVTVSGITGSGTLGLNLIDDGSIFATNQGQGPHIQGLGDLSGGPFSSDGYDIADNGQTVVGQGRTDVNNKAFRWTPGGMLQLENGPLFSHSSAVSSDGTVAVGWIWDQAIARVEAFRWNAATGVVPLGDLSGGTFESYANDVSADGNVIVGQGHTNSGYEAMRWTPGDGMIGLGDLPGGPFHSSAFGVSRNGEVIVGQANVPDIPEAFRWTTETGIVGLGDLPGGIFHSHAEDVLDDGNVVIGYGNSQLGQEAIRWTPGTGMVGLGDLDGGSYESKAWGGNADGTLIVGSGTTDLGREAFIWDATNGMRNLGQILTDIGVDMSGWQRLTAALAMTPEGRTVVGTGINSAGNTEAFIATLGSGLDGNLTGEVYTIDQMPPTVISINRATPAGPITNAISVDYEVIFSEPVTGVDPTDFALALGGSVTAATPVAVSGSGSEYTVTVSGITGNGTLGLNLIDDGSIFGSEIVGSAIPTVPVGNAGNAGELSGAGAGGLGVDAIVGAVAYDYRIATTEVTNAQYAAFLNAVAATDAFGLYNASMNSSTHGGITQLGNSGSFTYVLKSGMDTKPVNFVSWGDATRFANWFHNGQPTGLQDASTTEDGAYTLNGAITNAALNAVTRNVGAGWWLSSEDEWYKAAYHKNDGVTGNYWDYPTASDTAPTTEAPPGGTNSANSANAVGTVTDVGAYLDSPSPYGTFDQGGNVWEWNEALIGSFRGLRGSQFANISLSMRASDRADGHPAGEDQFIGFRVATVPELSGMIELIGGFTGQTYSIDQTPPAVVSINRTTPLGPFTNASNVVYTVTFSEPVTGIDPTDFSLWPTGSVTASSTVEVAGSGSEYTVTISGITGTGTLALILNNDGSVVDLAANQLTPGVAGFIGPSYTIDPTSPTVVSVNRTTPSGPLTNAASVVYSVTFSESVAGVDPTDFALAFSGGTAASIPVVSGSGSTYTVTVNGITGDGTLGLNLLNDGSIHDLATNPLTAGLAGEVYAIDQTAPFVQSINRTVPTFATDLDFNAPVPGTLTDAIGLGTGFTTRLPGTGNAIPTNDPNLTLDTVNGQLLVRSTYSSPNYAAAGYQNNAANLPTMEMPALLLSGIEGGDFMVRAQFNNLHVDYASDQIGVFVGTSINNMVRGGVYNDIPARGYQSGFQISQNGRDDAGGNTVPAFSTFQPGQNGVFELGRKNGLWHFSWQNLSDPSKSGTFATFSVPGLDSQSDLYVGIFNLDPYGVVNAHAGNGTPSTPYNAYLKSLIIGSGQAATTNASSVSYTVNFSEPVTAVDPTDFALALTGAVAATVTQVTPVSSTVYTVTVGGITGDGTLGLNLLNDGSIQDPASNPLASGLAGEIYTIDHTSPEAISIERTTPAGQSTNATSVTYTLTFSEPVTGVDPSDFALALSGGTAASSPVVVSGSGSVYTVTVSGITGDGTLGLNLLNDGSIYDGASNALEGSFAGQIYTIDHAPPTVVSIDRTTPVGPLTNASSVVYAVTFSESVTGVDPTDFALVLSGTLCATLTLVAPISGSVYLVTISGVVGNGALGLQLNNNGSIHDLASNALAAAFMGQAYSVDQLPPSVQSINRQILPPVSSLVYSNNFDGNEQFGTGVGGGLSGVTTLGGVQGYAAYGFSGNFLRNQSFGNPASPTSLTLNNLPAHSSVSLNFLLAIIDSWDGVGSPYGLDNLTIKLDGNTIFSHIFDNAGPTVAPAVAGGMQTYFPPTGVELARMVELGFRNIDNNDQDSAYNLGLDPAFANIPHSASTLTLEIHAGGAGWQGDGDESWAIENLSVSTNHIPPAIQTTNATSVTFAVTLSEPVTGVDPSDFSLALTGTVAGTVTQVTPVSGSVYTVTVSGITGDGTLGLNLVNDNSVQDLATNALASGFTGQVYTIDQTAPFVQSINRSIPVEEGTLIDGLVAHYELNGNALDSSGFGNNGATVGATPSVDRFGTPNGAYFFNGVDNYIQIPESTAFDSSAFSISLWFRAASYPAVGDGGMIISKGQNNFEIHTRSELTGPGGMKFNPRFIAHGVITDWDSPADSYGLDEWTHVVGVYDPGNAIRFYIDGDEVPLLGPAATPSLGDNLLDARLGMRTDNTLPFHGDIDDVRIYDRVLSGDEVDQLFSAASTVAYTVTFSESVTGVDPTDFSLVLTGTVAATVTQVTPVSSSVYTVTVSGISGDGTLGLNLVDDDSVQDLATNPLAGSFTGQIYTIDQTPPTVLSIDRTTPAGPLTNVSSVVYTVTFSEPVTGVDPTDFALALSGVIATTPVSVSGSGSLYTVTVAGIIGNGTLGLNLLNDGSIQDGVSALTGQVYWTNPSPYLVPDTILRSNTDGSGVQTVVSGLTQPRGMALDLVHAKMYWADLGALAIRTANMDGSGPVQTVVPTGDFSGGVALDIPGGKMYWTSGDSFEFHHGGLSGQVNRANLDGSNPENLVSGLVMVSGIAIDPVRGQVYWAQSERISDGLQSIQRANLDGSNIETVLTGIYGVNSLALDAIQGKLYWPETTNRRIQSANLDGSDLRDVVTGLDNPTSVTLDLPDGKMYWTNSYGVTPNALCRSNLDGTNVETVISSVGYPWGIAVVPESSAADTNPLAGSFTGQVYIIDQTAPVVQSINRTNPTGPTTNASSVTYTVTFSESVTGVDPTDFALGLTGGVTTVSPMVVAGSGAVYTVTISGITGEGTLGLNLVNNGSVQDDATNPLASGFTGQTYTIDLAAPEAVSIVRTTPATTSTNANSVAYTVTFSEPVTGVDPSDFALALTGTVGATLTQSRPISSSVYLVTVTGITGSGSLGLNLLNDGSIQDLLGNVLLGTLILDFNAPVPATLNDASGQGTGFTHHIPGSGSAIPTNDPNLTLNTANGQLIVGSTRSDFNQTGFGRNLAGMEAPALLLNGIGNGDFVAQARFSDLHVDQLSDQIGIFVGSSVDNVVRGGVHEGIGGYQSFVTYSQNGVDGLPSGGAINQFFSGQEGVFEIGRIGEIWHFSWQNPTGLGLDGTVSGMLIPGLDSQTDLYLGVFNHDARNAVSQTATLESFVVKTGASLSGSPSIGFVGETYNIDHVSPYVQSINRTTPVGPATNATSVIYTVTFNEPVTGVDPADFALALSGVTATTPVNVSGSGAVYTVTISGIAGTGTLGLNLVDDGTIRDAVNNPLRASSASPSFASPTSWSVGTNPYAVAVGDVNGDGKPDLVTANFGSDNVSVRLGIGDGTFGASSAFATGADPQSVAIADVNKDGKTDLVVSNSGSNTLGVLLGNGDGTFQSQTTFAVGSTPRLLTVADLNGDGALDLVVPNKNSNNVSVLLGNGNGTFQNQTTFATGQSPRGMTIADLNGDGRPDLIVANRYGTASVLLGNGDGTFAPQATLPIGNFPYSVAAADVNGDGKPDLVTANHVDQNLSLLLGNGDGTFQNQVTLATGVLPASAAIADVNGDGYPDLVVANYSDSTTSVLLGNGNGAFQNQVTFPTGAAPFFAAVADLNGDGRPDLVTANYGANSASVLLGNANGDFTGQVYAIDQTAPAVQSINRTTPAGASTNGGATFTVTFAEPVTGVDLTDFSAPVTGSVTYSSFFVSGSGSVYTVTFVGVSGNGTLGLDLVNDGSIADLVSNAMIAGFTGQVYTVDQVSPVVQSINRTTPAGPNTSATSVTYTVTFSEAITGVDPADFALALTGGVSTVPPVVVTGNGSVYTVTVNGIAGTGTLGLNLVNDGTIRDLATNLLTGGFTGETYAIFPATIAGRHLFYNQSGTSTRYDGNNLAINASDDNAIATDKTAYLWEAAGAATFANVSSYTKGINGIMVDITGSHPSISADDFIFRVGNNNSPGTWTTANAPTSISVRAGAGVGGSDRVTIIWNGAAAPFKQWLQVIVLANADTGLAQKPGYPVGHGDHFFFGNAVGNVGSGDTVTNSLVTSTDEAGIRFNTALIGANIPITNLYDVGRNASVSALDESAARLNGTNPTTSLKYLNLTTAPAAPEADGGGEVSPLVASGSGDSGVASALTAQVRTNLESRVPKWLTNRVEEINLNIGTPARLFQYLHDTNTPRSRALLQKFDAAADALGLDDELLDLLLADLGLE